MDKKLKVPPNNTDAEQAVLGSLLIDRNAVIKVVDLLSARDFYLPAHETIYNAILNLFETNQPIDVVSVTNYLKEKDLLKNVGGSGYLAELTSQIATASHVLHYASIVKEKKVLRDLIRTSAEIAEDAFDPEGNIEDLLDDVEQKIFAISQKSVPKNLAHIREGLSSAYERIENLNANKGAIRGVPTGFERLDSLLSGLQKSDLVVLGARPSLGKTSLVLDIARNAAVKHGKTVGIFSLEMSREQIIDRLIAAQAQVPLWKLRTGHLSDDIDFQMIQAALDQLSQAPLYIDDTVSPNIMQMRAMARRLQMEHGLDLLVIDYLQLIAPRRNSDNMVTQVTEISRGLKALARELNVPVLAPSQLSRAVDQRENQKPQLHDLRESGSIEQDADVVMFIYRKDRYKSDVSPEEQGLAEILVAKHRNGPLGTVKMKFDGEYATFRTIDEKHADSAPDF